MEELLRTAEISCFLERGRQRTTPLSVTGYAGDNILIQGPRNRRDALFEVFSGLRRPDTGQLMIAGHELYAMNAREAAAFRRDSIGAIPRDGGLIPELRLIDQVAMPLRQAGMEKDAALDRIRALAPELMPLHSLYNLPGQCNARKRACAVMLRAVVQGPKLLVLNGFLDEAEDLDREALWQALLFLRPRDSLFLYLSGSNVPEQVMWTRQLRI